MVHNERAHRDDQSRRGRWGSRSSTATALPSASALREETTAAAEGLAVSESVAGARPAPPAPDPTADGANATTGAEAGLRSAERRPSRRRKNVRKPGRASPAAPGIATNDEKDPVVGEFSFAGVVAELEASAAPEVAKTRT